MGGFTQDGPPTPRGVSLKMVVTVVGQGCGDSSQSLGLLLTHQVRPGGLEVFGLELGSATEWACDLL